MKKKICTLFMVLALLLLWGCGAEKDPERVDFSTAPTFPVEEVAGYPVMELRDDGARADMLSIDTEEGRIEAENRNGPDGAFCILTFRERDSERAYPMCALVSCTHDSPDCWAYAYDVRGMHYTAQAF